MGSPSIVGLLLAAGAATRFGGDKLVAPLSDGTPLGLAALRGLIGGVDAVVAVVRPGDDRLAGVMRREGARVTACPFAADGMGASLAWGVRASPLARAWLVALADMPWVRPESVARVADAMRSGTAIAAPSWRGARGHPVGFAAPFFSELSALSGDEGAKTILARHAVTLIPTDDPGVLRDVDVPLDLVR
jgi:molybdenum cofactor cytidylyltransferase